MGEVRSEHIIVPEGWRALHFGSNPTHGWESKKEGRGDQLSNEPDEQAYLGKYWAGHLHQRIGYRGRQ